MSDRPRIALTLGDVSGIGPELVARTIADRDIRERMRPVVVGHPEVLDRALRLVGETCRFAVIPRSDDLSGDAADVVCWNPGRDDAVDAHHGEVDARGGQAAYDALVGAILLARQGLVEAIVTAPLNKRALFAAGLRYPGHTEILAERCGVAEFAMMLYLPPGEIVRGEHGLGVAHVTLHTSIRSVPDSITTEGVAGTIQLMQSFLRSIGCDRPRIGVCALNPHAGEQGLFGDEEGRVIAPAVRQLRQAGVDAHGPLPADALLRLSAAGEFDGVVAMYHDQGHIALKLLGYDRAVNITLGLPIVRTSPSHGTAYDIAWQGKANPFGMLAACDMALKLAENRRSAARAG